MPQLLDLDNDRGCDTCAAAPQVLRVWSSAKNIQEQEQEQEQEQQQEEEEQQQ